MRGVHIGLGVSVVTCVLGAYLWQLVPNQPLYEGIAALTAAALVGAFLVQMLRMGRHMKQDIEDRVARVARTSGRPSGLTSGPDHEAAGGAGRGSVAHVAGIALVTALLITREGLRRCSTWAFRCGWWAAAPPAWWVARWGWCWPPWWPGSGVATRT